MTGGPLRPLASVLSARRTGESPDAFERERSRRRREEIRDHARRRAEGRLLVLSAFFLCAFCAIGLRMGSLAASGPAESRGPAAVGKIVAQRPDIVDRRGRVLATNLHTHSLYARPRIMIDPEGAARSLAEIFPGLDEEELLGRFEGKRKFLWIRKRISPEQMQAVHEIGEPGLMFGPRETRLYPNGAIAAHVLGGSAYGREGVGAAEIVGVAGVEKSFDGFLRDPSEGGRPLELSLDLAVQTAIERVLGGGMRLMNAKGAAAVLMDARSGEIFAMASLPDFDPNRRPAPPAGGDPSDSPLFNRAVQGLYELGSTFKTFAVAQALELGIVDVDSVVDASAPMEWGRHSIGEFQGGNFGPKLPVSDVLVRSSNVAAARLALRIGGERQRAFLGDLGILEPSPVELVEASAARPLFPERWSEISTITASYGHGVSVSQLHLAAAYAGLLNGGMRVTPTLLKRGREEPGPRILSKEVSADLRAMLRRAVTDPAGTGNLGDVPGYGVGGKTGTADKAKERGGYHDGKVVATFAAVFPIDDPRYVLVVTLDEPAGVSDGELRRAAGWTAAPVAAEAIRRAGPLLGIRPEIETAPPDRLSLTRN